MSNNEFYFGVAAKLDRKYGPSYDDLVRMMETSPIEFRIGNLGEYITIPYYPINIDEESYMHRIPDNIPNILLDRLHVLVSKFYKLSFTDTKFFIDFYYNGGDSGEVYTRWEEI